MTYATLEEAWGPDFNKKKKSRRDKRQETLGKKIADETIDSEIIIPKMADTRQRYESRSRDSLTPDSLTPDSLNGYDQFTNMYGSPYNSNTNGSNTNGHNTLNITSNDIIENNAKIEQNYRKNIGQVATQSHQFTNDKPTIESSVESSVEKVIQLTEGKYNKLVEGFGNQNDEQFNQLLLYIFTGIFYLFMLDLMYQLGKKSY
jgi:hypothetical protein